MPSRRAFTLVELLVVVVILGLLAGLPVPAIGKALQRSKQAASLSNIRQLGMGMLAYAADNCMNLPARAVGSGGVRWPRLLYDTMLPDVCAFVDPSDPKPASFDPDTFFRNNFSYVFNGFNDLATHDDPLIQINLNRLPEPSSTNLFSKKKLAARRLLHGRARRLPRQPRRSPRLGHLRQHPPLLICRWQRSLAHPPPNTVTNSGWPTKPSPSPDRPPRLPAHNVLPRPHRHPPPGSGRRSSAPGRG